MNLFSSNAMFQITACFALAHLFFNFNVKDDIVIKSKGIRTILGVMNTFSRNESLQTTAIFALGSIVMKNDLHRKETLEANGVNLIIKAMRAKFETAPKEKETNKTDSKQDLQSHSQTSDHPVNPEPVLYRRGNLKIQCSKPLLLQLFGSVALLNLSENEECRNEIIQSGGIHFIFEASQKVKDHPDLWFILYYIFSKFTKCGGRFVVSHSLDDRIVYMKPKGVPKLRDLACLQNMNTLFEQNEHDSQMDAAISLLEIPNHLSDYARKYHTCTHCKKACLESLSIRYYEMSRTRTSKMEWICSNECATNDEKFEARQFYRFIPSE
jgi:hypothetical protein